MPVNKIISTVNSISSDSTVIPLENNCVTIDTSNNRLGINTFNPKCAIDVSNTIDIFKNQPNNYDDISANTRISSLELEGYLLRLEPIPGNIKLNDISNHLLGCVFARKQGNGEDNLYYAKMHIDGETNQNIIAKSILDDTVKNKDNPFWTETF